VIGTGNGEVFPADTFHSRQALRMLLADIEALVSGKSIELGFAFIRCAI
jgi:hypothetical protein